MAKKYKVNGVEFDVEEQDEKQFLEEVELTDGAELDEDDSGNQQGPTESATVGQDLPAQNNKDRDWETQRRLLCIF